ncbi:MAG: HPP family protein [Peptococcaceae bacterium]|nr:HPP family protein [Peptococcaceae bacterium]
MEKAESDEMRDVNRSARSFQNYLNKMRCENGCTLPQAHWGEVLLSSVGAFLGIGPIALLSIHYGVPLLIPSFGASAVLLYAACHVPMAQPRNVFGGHVVSALAGVFTYQVLGNDWWAVTLAVMLAVAGMMLTRSLHPPGGATAFVAVYNGQNFGFVLTPVAVGSALLILVALLFNNLHAARKYPHYWF